ncbi:MAG: HAMP domain-containing protein [Clostridiales bacterium]|nr:HAMP domain-containing protein [Clostridiales bacterium]
MTTERIKLFKSLQVRLVYMFVLMTSALMIIAAISINNSVQSSYYKTFKTRIEKGFDEWRLRKNPTRDEISHYLREEKNAMFLFLITDYKTYSIIDQKTNEIIYSSDKLFEEDREKLLNQIQRSSNYVKALAGLVGSKDKLIKFKDKAYLDYAKPEGDFVLYFRYDRDDWKGTIDKFNQIIYISFFIAIISSLIVGYFLSKTITTPIKDIMYKAKKMAEGEFEETLEVKSDDEIGKLTETFNYMAGEIQSHLTELKKEKNKIETILHYMTDGVIAFDMNGELIHVNSIAKHILNKDVFDYTFYDFVKELDLDITISKVSELKPFETIEENIYVSDKFLKMQVVNFSSKTNFNEGIIFVICDNTKQQRLDNMRRDFVANVSHELRTPLTSIKGYTETLLDGGVSDLKIANKFLNVIDSETDRMIRLVNDLLQLTKIDGDRIKWNKSIVNMNKLVEFIAYKMNLVIKDKGLSMKLAKGKKVSPVVIDRDRIEQVIVNILSNSIKYTPRGGRIEIATREDSDYVKVRIKDTGIGIPGEDLPRICERFYRVDKARSRKQGGTGLGLSIAKEILEQQNGKMEIESELNKGTVVTIYLSKREQM